MKGERDNSGQRTACWTNKVRPEGPVRWVRRCRLRSIPAFRSTVIVISASASAHYSSVPLRKWVRFILVQVYDFFDPVRGCAGMRREPMQRKPSVGTCKRVSYAVVHKCACSSCVGDGHYSHADVDRYEALQTATFRLLVDLN